MAYMQFASVRFRILCLLFIKWFHDGEILSAKYGWLHMDDSIEFSHSLRFRSEYSRIDFYSLAKRNFFLAKPNFSLLRMR